jgi:hypothetical protein
MSHGVEYHAPRMTSGARYWCVCTSRVNCRCVQQALPKSMSLQPAADKRKAQAASSGFGSQGGGAPGVPPGGVVPRAGTLLVGFASASAAHFDLCVGGNVVERGVQLAPGRLRLAFRGLHCIPLVSLQYHEVAIRPAAAAASVTPVFAILDADAERALARRPIVVCDGVTIRGGLWCCGQGVRDEMGVDWGLRPQEPLVLPACSLHDLCSVVRVQRTWRRATADPTRLMCDRRLRREFGSRFREKQRSPPSGSTCTSPCVPCSLTVPT